VTRIEAYRKNMADGLQAIINICDERAGSYDSTVLRQIRARALNGLNCRPREWKDERECKDCAHRGTRKCVLCGEVQYPWYPPKGWHCSIWEQKQ